ncbi:PQQ-binding-like beta-propeller repeat protein [Armatimonas rosea]|uniref:PQQ-binding-like beta-propeller repeat protein n=1 Tax=Armatimonas rosea TaxID=685828 RepID=UPI001611175D|nr:PQQ-binding-like beta-propeller repeat protein [Armatimonas rosea]
MKAARFVFSVVALGVVSAALAADWPQFRGPERTGLSKETGLLKAWPDGGPKLAWKATGLGESHTTVSIAKGKVFGMGLVGEDEKVWALDEKTGKQLWSVKIANKIELQARQGGYGSRATPTVEGDFLYTIGVAGDVLCMKVSDGSIVWRKHLVTDFGGQVPVWGYSESPLVDGNKLIVTPGGQSAMVALNKTTGATIWKSPLRNRASYSSAQTAIVNGQKQYIQFLATGVFGVSATDGAPVWNYTNPGGGEWRDINCSMPLYRDGMVFAATAYQKGGGLVKPGAGAAQEQYFLREMQNHHGGMVLVGDYIYGTGNNSLMCVEFKTGKIVWESRAPGKGSITYADGLLYVRNERGPVTLVEANPKEYVQRGQFEQPDRTREPAWAYPVVANGKLYIHDMDTLLCYDIKGGR